ncbi:MAG: hypothetical protein V7L04_15680 [Nostoc sp.]|uniref:hypothetical protein n=1 Tax=Nostoc sp. TaxID=1180 RepID=UPI002FF537A3
MGRKARPEYRTGRGHPSHKKIWDVFLFVNPSFSTHAQCPMPHAPCPMPHFRD